MSESESTGISDLIESTIKENLKNENVFFIFPTDTDASSWANWVITHTQKRAVPAERFIAWDKFKGESIRVVRKGKNSIPSLLRKLFAVHILEKNQEAVRSHLPPVFESLISTDFVDNSVSFSSWISGILPSLAVWKRYFDAADKSNEKNTLSDKENADLFKLYTEYGSFLETNGLFEPSWEEADFISDNKIYVIFFPDILEDFYEYRAAFEKAKENVKLIFMDDIDIKSPDGTLPLTLYTNSRTELRETALKIRRLHEKDGVEWTDIAINVPDMETYRPYVERELELYCIPFVVRSGSPYTRNCAGQIFCEIRACRQNDYSYDSVRALLTDGYVPWKEKQCNENLVREGCNRKCICSYKDESGRTVDVWEKALSSAVTKNTAQRELEMYRKLKKSIDRFCGAKTFAEIQNSWFAFKDLFLAEEEFSEESDLILGQCLSILASLSDIENTYDIHIKDPYSFFISELEEKTYQLQPKTDGVSVFAYKVSAASAVPHQFVIDANQKDLSIRHKPLSFLTKEKRKALGLEEGVPADRAFIRLYAKKSSYFSCAENSFSGFKIPHSFFNVGSGLDSDKAPYEEDFIKYEEAFFKSDFTGLGSKSGIPTPAVKPVSQSDFSKPGGNFPCRITEGQKECFERWKQVQVSADNDSKYFASETLAFKINYMLCEDRGKHTEPSSCDKIHVTESDMKQFFPCPRKWIFSRVLKLEEDSLDTDLMNPSDDGNICHKVLELFMNRHKGKQLPQTLEDGTFLNEEATVRPLVLECVEDAINSPEMSFSGSPLVSLVLESQKKSYADQTLELLKEFCKPPPHGFGGHVVYAAEEWFNEASLDGGEHYLMGKIDCILCDDAGGVSIVDYKLKNSPPLKDCIVAEGKDTATAELSDFQIPMYISLWNLKHKGKKSSVRNALFFTIRDKKKHFIVKEGEDTASKAQAATETAHADTAQATAGIAGTTHIASGTARAAKTKIKEVDIDGFNPTLECFNRYVKQFTEDVQSNNFSPKNKKVRPFKDCLGCVFSNICRTNFEISGEKI
ncbi:PD-(D/E)XK nuclease family protein [Treponema parvum]|uniref:PD-(D/E)XK nuclease family protein n=1 Tax=Treponema parvum TaxID=138851 RepID=A0A975F3W2_9SPIR|nr:PD-(D/E)XK nuclease family protein [Treponema parvum]QTQ13900.1 PD-(D/E)XK nuclease family protein [Treponema parvum]